MIITRCFALCAALLLTLSLFPSPAAAQTVTPAAPPNSTRPFDFYARGPYRADLPRPSAILGYEPGEFHTNYANFERVLREYEGKTDRLKVFERGKTPEYRPMYLLAISAPENMAKLETIKTNVAKLADPRKLPSEAEATSVIAETPIVVWLSYSIHGNESAAFEAAIHVLYTLLASEDPKILDLLKKTVVLINPAQNPDGHERFATWYNAVGIGRPEPYAYEHSEPWSIYGRLNHYLFDLNRDMLVASQVESQSAMKAFLEWHPQVSADHHGQTANYFFPPAALPINPNINRQNAEKWLDVFGRGNAAAFDQYGWQYYVRDVFDLFYPGYWDSWPSLNGATGMTYETDGGGWKGLNWRRDDESILTLRDGIARHVTASLATVETAAANREARLRDYRRFYQEAMDEGAKGKIRQFIIAPDGDPGRIAQLIAILVRNGVEVRRATTKFTVKNAHDYFGGVRPTREFPAGSYVVSLNQPQGRLIRAFLEPDTKQDPEFVARQLEKIARNEGRGENAPREDSEFYDITAWTLPLTFGVDGYWSEEAANVAGTLERLETLAAGSPTAPPSRATTAYVFSPDTEAADKLALRLLQEGYKVATAIRPLRAGGKDYARGALIVRVERNPEGLHQRIASLAVQLGVKVDAVNSAYADMGITGVGSEAVVTLKSPRVAMIADDAVSQTSYGALWYALARDFDVEFTPITIDTFKGIKMSEYNVLILPDGGPGAYKRMFGKDGIERLKAWCNDGGTLICIAGAAAFAADKDVDLTSARLVGSDEAPPAAPPADPKAKPDATPAKKKDGAAADAKPPTKPLFVPGAIMRAAVNREHFLTFGFERPETPVLVNSDRFYNASKTGTNVLTVATEKPRLSGFVWPNNTEPLVAGTSWLIEEPTGGGHVVVFAAEPNFRYIWHSTTRMFLNSLIYAPTITFSTGLKK
jgi:hypothetical protein